jgi:hypothetical protein
MTDHVACTLYHECRVLPYVTLENRAYIFEATRPRNYKSFIMDMRVKTRVEKRESSAILNATFLQHTML